MTVTTLVPTATNSVTGTVVGAASAHAALLDATDGAYIDMSISGGIGKSVNVSLSDLALPAGAVVKQITTLLNSRREAPTSGNPALGSIALTSFVLAGPHTGVIQSTVNWSAATYHWGGYVAAPTISDANVDAATLAVGTSGTDGVAAYLFGLWLHISYVTLPVADVAQPSGTITTTSAPNVTWNHILDADGGAQTHYQVQIKDAGDEVVSESGVLAGEGTTWQSVNGLADGSYEASVRVAQTVNGTLHWSAYNDQAFTIDVPQPATPTLSLTPEAASGRIRVLLTDPGGGAVSTDFFSVEVSYDGGTTWAFLRAGTSGLISLEAGAATVYNYDAPNGTLVSYRARAIHWFIVAGVVSGSYSDYVKDTDVWSSNDWWLKHPTRPSLNFKPTIRSQPTRSSGIAQGVFHPLGRRLPIVVSDIRQASTGEVELRSDTDAARASLDAILADGSPLLLQAPAATYWEDTWLTVGQHDRTRPIDAGWSAYTFDNLAWTEVEPPTESLAEGE